MACRSRSLCLDCVTLGHDDLATVMLGLLAWGTRLRPPLYVLSDGESLRLRPAPARCDGWAQLPWSLTGGLRFCASMRWQPGPPWPLSWQDLQGADDQASPIRSAQVKCDPCWAALTARGNNAR